MSEDVDSPSNRRQRALAAWFVFWVIQTILSSYSYRLREIYPLFFSASGRLY